jgi:hypothetical protein
MEMSKFIAALVIVVVCLGSVTVYGAEPSKASLSALGLGGMQPMSDAQGSKVRGMGAIAWGSSYANGVSVFSGSSAGSNPGYLAVYPHAAAGFSYATASSGFTSVSSFGTSAAFGW